MFVPPARHYRDPRRAWPPLTPNDPRFADYYQAFESREVFIAATYGHLWCNQDLIASYVKLVERWEKGLHEKMDPAFLEQLAENFVENAELFGPVFREAMRRADVLESTLKPRRKAR
jgi:hypothetical protein